MILWCQCVKCSTLHNGDDLLLIIYECYSWEVALNVDPDYKGLGKKTVENKERFLFLRAASCCVYRY
jgi:hypothetical protein